MNEKELPVEALT